MRPPKGMQKVNCRCPAGATRVSTNGRGRGWNCQGPKRGKWRPFVASVCELVPKKR
jgi:hypothetical protein